MLIYVDGSAHPNPGPGGFGVVSMTDDGIIVLECHQEQFEYTTNNEMELAGCLYALAKYGIKNTTCFTIIPTVYCDSSYAINVLTNWKNNWKKKGWIKSDKKIPENLHLIKKYDIIEEKGYKINLKKVEGHNGVLGNIIADKLATGQMTEQEVMKRYGK